LDEQNFVVADIPGLIVGAHAGHGLGHEFLRHVERTRLLVHLVEAVPLDGSDPLQNYRTIRNELIQYSPALAERPELLVVTKLDLTGAVDARARMEHHLQKEVLGISAVTGQGIPHLIHRIVEFLGDRLDRRPEPIPVTPDTEMPAALPITGSATGV
jgi:GTP-binding protein